MADDLEVARLKRERDELRTKLERLQGLYDATTGGTEFHEVPGADRVVLHSRVPKHIAQLAKDSASRSGGSLSDFVTRALAQKLAIDLVKAPGHEVLDEATDAILAGREP